MVRLLNIFELQLNKQGLLYSPTPNVLVQPQPPTLPPPLILLLPSRLQRPLPAPTLLKQQKLPLHHHLPRELQPRPIACRLHQWHGLEDQAVSTAIDGLCAAASHEVIDDDITVADGRSAGWGISEVWDQVAEGLGEYDGWGKGSCGDGWKWAWGCWRDSGVDEDRAAVSVIGGQKLWTS